jgi:putative membrane protein
MLWLKAFHIIGVVAWFAGLFYIFRLFVYHVENREKTDVIAVLEVMERRLYRAICWPAMIFTTAFGLALVSLNPAGYLQSTWFQIKLVGLVGLFGYHFYSGKVRKDLARGEYRLTSRQCRMINEAPTVLLILIVIMAVVKPLTN